MFDRRLLTAALVLLLIGPASALAIVVDSQLAMAAASSSPGELLRVIVTFDHEPTSADAVVLDSLSSRHQILQALPMAFVEITSTGLTQLKTSPGIASLYLDQPLEYYLHESVPLIEAPRSWQELGVTGEGIGIAILDSGVDATHPDLPFGTKVVQNIKLVGLGAEDDPTGTGIVVPIEGLPNSDTSSGHGTHCAGTAAGIGEASHTGTSDDVGGYGYFTGVAPGAHIVGIGAGDTILITHAVEGFDWVLSNHETYNIKVISNSWGSTMSPNEAFDSTNPVNVASKAAYDAGMTVVFAAGNSGPGTDTLNRYSVAPWVIGVAAGNKDGETIADFSSRGRYEDDFFHPTITAPGVDIVSTRANNTVLPPLGALDDASLPTEWLPYYTTMSGTSMATPHVSGVVALLYEARSDMTPDLAKRLIVNTATPLPAYGEYAVGAGYINAYAAVAQARAIKQIKAYRDPRTGKEIEVFVTEETLQGSVLPAVASYNDVARDDQFFSVANGAIFLDVKLWWGEFANDIDLYLYSEDQSTEPPSWKEESSSQDFQALTLDAREGVAIDYPQTGNWRAEVRGWLNAPVDYSMSVQQYFPITKGKGH